MWQYNMSIVTKGLRQPKRMARVENKALNMLADLKDNKPEAAESLMKRLTPDVREKIITHASEHLFNEELNRVAWDQVCDGRLFANFGAHNAQLQNSLRKFYIKC